MALNTTKPATYTPEQCQTFEAANVSRGKVQEVKFDSDATPDKPARFFIAKPNRQQLSAVTETAERDKEAANDLLINTAVLAGDVDQLMNDDGMYFGLLNEIGKLVQAKKKI